jgi:hypothetical protein
VLDPDDRDTLLARPVDKGPDVGDDGIALICVANDALLDVDDEEGGIGSI